MKALRTSAATSPGSAYLTLAFAFVGADALEGRTSWTHSESGSGVKPALARALHRRTFTANADRAAARHSTPTFFLSVGVGALALDLFRGEFARARDAPRPPMDNADGRSVAALVTARGQRWASVRVGVSVTSITCVTTVRASSIGDVGRNPSPARTSRRTFLAVRTVGVRPA